MPKVKLNKEKLKRTKIIINRSLFALVGIIFGIVIAAQSRSLPTRVTNPIAPYVSLKETREDLYDEQTELQNEILQLHKSIEKTQKESENSVLSKHELDSLNNKRALAGLTKLNGPGVILTLNDSTKTPVSENSIIHAADLRDIVNLLWGAGAEAISINNQRIVLNSSIDCIVNTILLNDVKLSVPFQIEAIGDQSLMFARLTDANLLVNIHERVKKDGLIFNLQKNNDITVPIFNGGFQTGSKGDKSV